MAVCHDYAPVVRVDCSGWIPPSLTPALFTTCLLGSKGLAVMTVWSDCISCLPECAFYLSGSIRVS